MTETFFQKVKKFVEVLVIIVVASVVIWCATSIYYRNNPIIKEKVVKEVVAADPVIIEKEINISAETIESGLRDVGILTTAEYYFTHVTKEDSHLTIGDFSIPLTESYYIYSYDGVVTAGINFEDINVSVDKEKRTIYVSIPAAQILSCEIDENSFCSYDEKNNIFNPVTVERYAESFKDMIQDEKVKAFERGILKEAEKNAAVVIKDFMKGLYDANSYEVKISNNRDNN